MPETPPRTPPQVISEPAVGRERPTNPPAPGRDLSARLAQYYRSLPVQRALVVIVLATASYLQYYLVNLPIADLAQTTKFSPATVIAWGQVASFKNPESDPGQFEFGFEQPAELQAQRMMVDANFDHASLSNETIHKLAGLGVQAPPQADAISYLTSGDPNVRCDTAVKIQTKPQTQPPIQPPIKDHAADFWQSEAASSDQYRMLEMKMKGLDSTVTVASQGTFGDSILSPSSCKLTLRVGDWRQTMQGFLPIIVEVPAGAAYRLHWNDADVKIKGWNRGGPALPLLSFGPAHHPGFRAEEISVASVQTAESANPHEGLLARSAHKNAPLTIDSLLIGTDRLQFGASGKGRVWEDGKPIVTVNLLDTINKYPLPAGLLTAGNLLLLNWAKRRFFPPARATSVEAIASKPVNDEKIA